MWCNMIRTSFDKLENLDFIFQKCVFWSIFTYISEKSWNFANTLKITKDYTHLNLKLGCIGFCFIYEIKVIHAISSCFLLIFSIIADASKVYDSNMWLLQFSENACDWEVTYHIWRIFVQIYKWNEKIFC